MTMLVGLMAVCAWGQSFEIRVNPWLMQTTTMAPPIVPLPSTPILQLTRQPLDALLAKTYKIPRGIAMYNLSLCSDREAIKANTNRMIQVGSRAIPLVDPSLVDGIVFRNREASRGVKVTRAIQFAAGIGTAVVTAYGSHGALPAWQMLIAPAVGILTPWATKEISAAETPVTADSQWLRLNETVIVDAGDCYSKMVLGRFVPNKETVVLPWQ